jgi:hypothetical protein
MTTEQYRLHLMQAIERAEASGFQHVAAALAEILKKLI